MNKNFKKWIFSFFSIFQTVNICAHQPYHAIVTVDTTSTTVSAPNLVDLQRELNFAHLEKLLPGYTPNSAASLEINLRGLAALTSFAANSTTLVVSIPNTDISTTFTGSTRDESLILFKEFVKEGSSLSKLLKGYARYSPIDPIAGNPNSLMAQMSQSDYLLGRLSPISGCCECWSAQPIVHQFQSGTHVERAFAEDYDTTAVTLPLRYSFSPDLKWAIILDAPFTYNRNGGASSVFSSLGMGLRYPLTCDWSLTPVLRLGLGGSLDLCTSGSFFSAGLTSEYNYLFNEHILSLTNYAGYTTSTNLWLTGVNFNYHLHNTIFKNGLCVTSCTGFTVYDRPISFKLGVEDTYFAGHRLFIRHFDEATIAIIANNVNPNLEYDCLSLAFAYKWGQKQYNGYSFNLDYQF